MSDLKSIHFRVVYRNGATKAMCQDHEATEFAFLLPIRARGSQVPDVWLPIKSYHALMTVVDRIAREAFDNGQIELQDSLMALLGVDRLAGQIENRIESIVNPYTG